MGLILSRCVLPGYLWEPHVGVLLDVGVAEDAHLAFGAGDALMQDRLKVLDSLRQRLNSDKRLFKSLNDNADRATRAGNQIATEANESITQQSARTLDLIGRVTTTPALNARGRARPLWEEQGRLLL